eukprot:RCo033998
MHASCVFGDTFPRPFFLTVLAMLIACPVLSFLSTFFVSSGMNERKREETPAKVAVIIFFFVFALKHSVRFPGVVVSAMYIHVRPTRPVLVHSGRHCPQFAAS